MAPARGSSVGVKGWHQLGRVDGEWFYPSKGHAPLDGGEHLNLSVKGWHQLGSSRLGRAPARSRRTSSVAAANELLYVGTVQGQLSVFPVSRCAEAGGGPATPRGRSAADRGQPAARWSGGSVVDPARLVGSVRTGQLPLRGCRHVRSAGPTTTPFLTRSAISVTASKSSRGFSRSPRKLAS